MNNEAMNASMNKSILAMKGTVEDEFRHNKRRSRTAILCVKVAYKTFVEQTTINSTNRSNLTKISRWSVCLKNSGRLLQRLFSSKIDTLRTSFVPFCKFSLSTFQSEGHSQNLVHLRNIQRDVNVNSDLDGQSQRGCFREGRV